LVSFVSFVSLVSEAGVVAGEGVVPFLVVFSSFLAFSGVVVLPELSFLLVASSFLAVEADLPLVVASLAMIVKEAVNQARKLRLLHPLSLMVVASKWCLRGGTGTTDERRASSVDR